MLSAEISTIPEAKPVACFNPFQGIQVLSAENFSAPFGAEVSFNPFQGIQVLSAGLARRQLGEFFVSIPFREFKCCRPSLSQRSSYTHEFQSLSGNSSVVGRENYMSRIIFICVSIPFREFKCCRYF